STHRRQQGILGEFDGLALPLDAEP
ncbi:MAG: hypothetical protein RLZ96_201, partial [Actinomycetota bacterium]